MNDVRNNAAAFRQRLRTETLSLIISLQRTIDEGKRLLDKLTDVELIAHKADDLYQDITNDIIGHESEPTENCADAAATKADEDETPPEVCDTSNGSDCS